MSSSQTLSINCGGRILDLSRPQVMGILNITPDSFYDGGQLYRTGGLAIDQALMRAEQMVNDGAALVDIGGESTRPGAKPVSLQEEMDRVLPVVEAMSQRIDTIISVDSSNAAVMLAAASAGAGLLNDVRALSRPGAIEAAQQCQLPVCLMHMQGEPHTMQHAPCYDSVVDEVSDFLTKRVACCVAAGIDRKNIILDPGFGFGKKSRHNLTLLNQLSRLKALGLPLLVGLSRKSLIGDVLGRALEHRLAGSVALATLAAVNGASIIRAHDVAATADALNLYTAMLQEG